MRHFLSLGIAAMVILSMPSWAQAQENQTSPPSAEGDRTDMELNRQRVTLPGTTRDRPYDPFFGASEFSIGGGASTVNAGDDESYGKSAFGFAQLGVRTTGTRLGHLHLQPGLRLFSSGSYFESHSWRGESILAGGGLEFSLFPVAAAGEIPRFSLNIRPMVSFEREVGNSRLAVYRLHHQDTVYFNGQVTLELYPFIRDSFRAKSMYGEFDKGWFPAIQFRFDVDQSLWTDKSSTAKDLGFTDKPSRKDHYGLTTVIYLRRDGTQLGLIDYGFVFGVDERYAAGYHTVKDRHAVTQLTAGATVRMQLAPPVFLYLNAGATYELKTERVGVYGSISINLVEWAETFERWVRTPSEGSNK